MVSCNKMFIANAVYMRLSIKAANNFNKQFFVHSFMSSDFYTMLYIFHVYHTLLLHTTVTILA